MCARLKAKDEMAKFPSSLDNRCLLLADGFYEKGVRFWQPGGQLFSLREP
jgi:putative SOS response-associated peptidase YedK